jgi:hypothetical protein
VLDKIRTERNARRKKNRRVCATVELGERELDFLVRNLWLREDEAHDAKRIAAAIEAMLRLSARI